MDTDNHNDNFMQDLQYQQQDTGIYDQQDTHAEQFQQFQQIENLNNNTDGHNTGDGYGI